MAIFSAKQLTGMSNNEHEIQGNDRMEPACWVSPKGKNMDLKGVAYYGYLRAELEKKFKEAEFRRIYRGNVRLREDYPSGWDKDVFKSLTSFKQKIAYCKTNLEYMVSGSSRIAFNIDDEKVLKLAKNEKGKAQNEVEIMHHKSGHPITAPIYDYDEDDAWLEMAYAEKLTKLKFKKITGFSWDDFSNAMWNEFSWQLRLRFGHKRNVSDEEIYESEFFQNVASFVADHDLPFQDYARLSSFGIIDGEIKLIDFGINADIYETFYGKRRT